MSSFGLTPTGFNRKRLDTLLEELNAELRSIFGDNFDIDPNSPQGQLNGTISESNANLWEIGQAAYNAFRPSAATGDALSELVQLNNITRQAATPSTVSLTLAGTNGTLIPSGSLVETDDTAERFATLFDVTIDAGAASVDAASVNLGPITGLADTITVIVNPISGWDTATNPLDAEVGSDEETDGELRIRRRQSTAIQARSVIDSIFARISDLPGVLSATVLENDTSSTDANGLVEHSIEAIVEGGEDNDIAYAIWNTKTGGSSLNGNTPTIIKDSQGFDQTMNFTRPTLVDIYVDIVLVKGPDYPTDGDDQIKQAILDYADGNLIPGRSFGVGDDVILSELYTPVNIIDDISITSLQIGTSASTAAANIPIDIRDLSDWDSTRINITV